jgi:hypothetical protein
MLTLNVTNRIIMKITVWLIPTRERFDNYLLKKLLLLLLLLLLTANRLDAQLEALPKRK